MGIGFNSSFVSNHMRCANSAINIMNLTKCWIEKQERLPVFKFRLSPLQIIKRKRKKLDHRR